MGGSSDSGNSGVGRRIGEDVFGYYGTKYGNPTIGIFAREIGGAIGDATENYLWHDTGVRPDYDNFTAMGDYGGNPGQRADDR